MKKQRRAEKSGPLSLAPLTLEEALRAAMQVDPNKIPDLPKPKKKRKAKKRRS